jgi:hypothetical protein
LNYVGNPLTGLLGAVGVKLDSVAKHFGAGGDRLEGDAIAGAGIDRRRRLVREQEKSANPLGFGKWQRVKAKPSLAFKAQNRSPFSERLFVAVAFSSPRVDHRPCDRSFGNDEPKARFARLTGHMDHLGIGNWEHDRDAGG